MTGEESEPDYRFTYANERTFLAWIRTAVAFIGGGVAAVQLLPAFDLPGGRQVIGAALTALGGVIAVTSRLQWQANDRAMRRNEPLPESRMINVVGGAVVLLAVVVTVVVVAGS